MDSNHHHDDSNDDSNNEIEAINNTQIYLFLFILLPDYRCLHNKAAPIPSHCQWTGQEVINNLLNCGSPTRIHNQLRMKLDTFYQLRDWLTRAIVTSNKWQDTITMADVLKFNLQKH
jgi:hypothetical protein